jgi:hypothetical protein
MQQHADDRQTLEDVDLAKPCRQIAEIKSARSARSRHGGHIGHARSAACDLPVAAGRLKA